MAVHFPEVTTFGTLMSFAMALEELAIELCVAQGDPAAGLAKKHKKRLARLEEVRRERLNEVILEPLHGVDAARHLDGLHPSNDESAARLALLERRSADFYLDSARLAGNMLAEIARIFERLAKENQKLSSEVEPLL